jgi:hypothetical protein
MLRYPWVTDRREDATPGYHFSDLCDLFRHVVLEVPSSEAETSPGWIVLSVVTRAGETAVKILDHSVGGSGKARALVAAGLTYAARYRADRVELPDCCGGVLDASIALRRVFRRHYRPYYCLPRSKDSPLAQAMAEVELGFCDGDIASS